MSDRSFIRFGGLAGILLALTSWAALLASNGTDARRLVGLETSRPLYALVVVWALFGVVAVHWVSRRHGEAWSFFATLVGVSASLATLAASLYPMAVTRDVLRQPVDIARPLSEPTSPTDPLGVMSLGLTGLWFLVANLLLLRGAVVSRRLAFLGLVVAVDLLGAFVATLAAQGSLAALASFIAFALAGPVYWLWLGVRLRRLA